MRGVASGHMCSFPRLTLCASIHYCDRFRRPILLYSAIKPQTIFLSINGTAVSQQEVSRKAALISRVSCSYVRHLRYVFFPLFHSSQTLNLTSLHSSAEEKWHVTHTHCRLIRGGNIIKRETRTIN